MDGPRQIAIKKFWNTWLAEAAKNNAITESAWKNNKTITNTFKYNSQGETAKREATSNYAKGEKASITATQMTLSGSNPASRVNYLGTIQSIVVKDTNNNTIASSNIEYYTDAAHKNKISSITQIPNNGTPFYIKNKSNKTIKNIMINVKRDDTYQVEFWLLESTGCLGAEYVVPRDQVSACQKLMVVKDKILPTSDNVTININIPPPPTDEPEEPEKTFQVHILR